MHKGLALTAAILAANATTGLHGQGAARTYTATATVKTAAGATATAPVTITVTRWSSDEERAKAQTGLKAGTAPLKKALDAMPDAGTIEVGSRTTPLKYARMVTTGGGSLVTVVATKPILYLGAGVPEPRPKAGHDFAFATFEVDASGKGTAGDLAPAATLKLGENDALVVDDYGVEAVRLTDISSK
jgi:hypothetical protein